MSEKSVLEVRGVSKHFGGLQALTNFDLQVKRGEIAGLIGPNGAGKTTTFNLITGFDSPSRGEILLEGQSLMGKKPHEICQMGITRTFQQAKPLFGMTILENIMVGALNRMPRLKDAIAYSEEILDFLGLQKYRDTLVDIMPIGYRKVLEIGKCLATMPKLLLLDEAMAGLNPKEMELVLDKIRVIRERQISILLIEHVIEAVVTICDRITVINFGVKICEGIPQEVVRDPAVINAYLGSEY